jgi:Fe2+ transport system protein FeoA
MLFLRYGGIIILYLRKGEDMKLSEVPAGKLVKLSLIEGGRGVFLGLSRLGIFQGDLIRVLESAPFRGPILIEHIPTGAKIAIGRGMARRIVVELVDETS